MQKLFFVLIFLRGRILDVYVCMYVCVYIYIYIYIYVCVCVCVCVCVLLQGVMSPYFLSSTLRFECITKGAAYNPRKYMALSKL